MSRIDELRLIVTTKTARKVDNETEFVDLFTAGIMVQVHDALSTPELQDKFNRIDFHTLVKFCYKQVK